MSDVDPDGPPTPSRWSIETETDEADAAEQQRDLIEDPSVEDPEAPAGRGEETRPVAEADEADLVEQAIEVDGDDGFEHD
jgi:hypothetical protein